MAVRLRRFLKRVLKPFVMVGIVGTLSVSLIVTTPSNAQAFVPPPVVPAVFGATTMVIPQLMATSSVLGPVGWGIAGVTALGIGIYATRDYWLPYVTGAFGAAQDEKIEGGNGTSPTRHSVTSYTRSGTDNNTFTVMYNNPGGGSNGAWYAQFGMIAKCKLKTDGTIKYSAKNGWWSIASNSGAGAWNYSIALTPCGTGWTTEGFVIGGGAGGTRPQFQPNYNGTTSPAAFDGTGQYQYATKNTFEGGDMGIGQFDPRSADVKYRVEAECVAPDGKIATATALSTGNAGGITFPSCEQAGLGHGTGKVTVWATPPGTQTEQNIWSATAPTTDPGKPLCDPKRPGGGCKLAVKIDTKDCVMGLFECENWAELNKDPNWSPRISCQYGPYAVAIETCNPLERAYEEGGAPATEPNVDGNTSTRNDSQPDGSTAPKTSTQPGPIPGGAAAGPVPGSTTQQAECFPTGWAILNPIEWVMKPVGCALDAAFKPKKDLQARLAGMQGQFSNKVPVSWFGVGVGGVSGGACPADWAVSFEGQRYSLICGTQADNIIRGFRPVLGAMLVMAMLWPFIRSLFYAAIPVFKVTPS